MVDTITITDSIGKVIYTIAYPVNVQEDTSMSQIANIFERYLNTVQNSEPSWWKYVIPAALSLVVALCVFSIGKRFEKHSERNKKEQDYRQKCEAIKMYVGETKKSVAELLRIIKTYRKKVLGDDIQFGVFNVCEIPVDCLKQYSINDLSLIFITNRVGDDKTKSEYLYKMVNSIEFLNTCKHHIEKYYEKEQEKAQVLFDRWTECYRNLINSNIKLITNNQFVIIPTKYADLAEKSQGGSLHNQHKFMDDVLMPMDKFLIEQSDKFDSLEWKLYKEQLNELKSIIALSSEIDLEFNNFLKKYEDLIEKSYKTLQKSIDYLAKNDFVKTKYIQ